MYILLSPEVWMPALNKRARFRAPFQNLPLDILPPIIGQLTDRKDWHACALVSKAFNRIATPLLYRTLDSRIISKVGKNTALVLFGSPEMPIDSMSRALCCQTHPAYQICVIRGPWLFASPHNGIDYFNTYLTILTSILDFGSPSFHYSPSKTKAC